VFILSLIGTASALGQSLVIPIVLRSLAGSMPIQEKITPPWISPDFFLTLDTGEHEIVKDYKLKWWSGRKPRDLNTVDILGPTTVKTCLDHFREQISKSLDNGDVQPRSTTNSFSGSTAGSGLAPAESRISLDPDAGAGSSSKAGFGAGDECNSCSKYRQLLSDVLQDVVKYKNFASDMSTSSENLFVRGIRKASTFNLLHEAALLKETAGISPPAQRPVASHIANISRRASSELNRLNELPASSYKWTWGETLTENEVLNLRRPGTRPGRAHHSGYDVSLAEGRPGGEYSDYSTKFSAYGQPAATSDDLPAEATIPLPPNEHQFPLYFSNPDHRYKYDPYRLSMASGRGKSMEDVPAAAFSSQVPASLTGGPQLVEGIAALTNDNIDFADAWSVDEDPAQLTGEPRVVEGIQASLTKDNIDFADAWSGDEGPEPLTSDPRAVEGIAASLSGTQNDNIDFADAWSGDEGPAPVADDSKVVEVPVVGTPNDNIDFADAWSGDEGPAPLADDSKVVEDRW
jgi:hypothetical protein